VHVVISGCGSCVAQVCDSDVHVGNSDVAVCVAHCHNKVCCEPEVQPSQILSIMQSAQHTTAAGGQAGSGSLESNTWYLNLPGGTIFRVPGCHGIAQLSTCYSFEQHVMPVERFPRVHSV
jgi:hypothetical protein